MTQEKGKPSYFHNSNTIQLMISGYIRLYLVIRVLGPIHVNDYMAIINLQIYLGIDRENGSGCNFKFVILIKLNSLTLRL